MSDVQVIVFTRFPVPGHVKTRLMAELGPDGAAELHRRMTKFTVTQIRQTGIKVENFDLRVVRNLKCGNGWILTANTPQNTGDLGARMGALLKMPLTKGKKVLVVRSDCPDNRAANMLQAVKLLNDAPCVGPAADGGYYLIRLCEPVLVYFGMWIGELNGFLNKQWKNWTSTLFFPRWAMLTSPVMCRCKFPVIIPAINRKKTIFNLW
ncbi:MAG: DUF2064 domain-containing protein [Desulfobacterales bacterium]